MKIESIQFKNYRQYRDARIDFAYAGHEKSLTVIQGPNGSGKTNILNAISWCLYGEELHLGDKYKGLPIINTITLAKTVPNQLVDVAVEITMSDDTDKRWLFKRTLECRKLADKRAFEATKCAGGKSRTEGKLEVCFQRNRNWEFSTEPEYRVQRLLPKAIQEYFFFDCERLNEYFRNPYPERIKNEVFKISQLGLFQDVISRLEKRHSAFSKQLKEVSPKADELREIIEKRKQELEQLERKLDQLKQEKIAAEKLERELSEKLKALPFSEDKATELHEKRQRLEKEANSLGSEIAELRNEQWSFLLSMAPIILGYSAVSTAAGMMTEKTGKGEIPPDYKSRFIRRILGEGRCICHTDISKDGNARKAVEDLLKHCDEIDEISQEIIAEENNLSRLMSRTKIFPGMQRKYGVSIRKGEERIGVVMKLLKEAEEQLEGVNDEEIRTVARRYRMVREEWERLVDQMGRIKSQRDSIQKEIEQLNKRFQAEIQKIEKHEDLNESGHDR